MAENTKLKTVWAAGLFEGEGCFDVRNSNVTHPYGKYHYENLRLQLDSTDKDVLEKFKKYVGIGLVHGPYVYKNKTNRKPYWKWSVSDGSAVRLAFELLPFLGKRRTQKLKTLMRSHPAWRIHKP